MTVTDSIQLPRGMSFSKSSKLDAVEVAGGALRASRASDSGTGTDGLRLCEASSGSAQLKGVDLASDSKSPL